jgi:hypothetical protein
VSHAVSGLLVFACVYWLNRDGLWLNNNVFFVGLAAGTCCDCCNKADRCKEFDAFGHLSLLFLSKGRCCAICLARPGSEVRVTWVIPIRIIGESPVIRYGFPANRRFCDAKASFCPQDERCAATCCGRITKPPRCRCYPQGDTPRKIASHRGRPARIRSRCPPERRQ